MLNKNIRKWVSPETCQEPLYAICQMFVYNAYISKINANHSSTSKDF